MRSVRSISFITAVAVFVLTVGSSTVTEDNALSAYDVLKQYNFPVGILPKGVIGYEINRNSGKFKVYLKETCSFSIEGYDLKYKSTITGTIIQGRIYDLKGISVNVVIFWWNIQEVRRDGDKLQLSVGIASASFSVDEFNESPQCGCGFDCLNGGERKKTTAKKLNRLISLFLD
ncbi:uncharacterized protein At5g01610-like [Impatiens glandulifera]|uniref:uncharacterized protein At5g01610-like n=1 Tax=Impatiens glandulifera TaxID=253017 RepID=UPI001FB19E31|nr:uncharacterized protein At5g01610-like [Impatiens glandulifera]